MTRPTVIFWGPDGVGEDHKKVFIRMLLYSTADRGMYLQNMFVRLKRGESYQNFNVWVYDQNGLVRGSGLFIKKDGIAINHHFLLPRDGSKYIFLSGEYTLEIFVEVVNKKPIKIFEQTLAINKDQEKEMTKSKIGIYFDWAPNSQTYSSHVDLGLQRVRSLNDRANDFTN